MFLPLSSGMLCMFLLYPLFRNMFHILAYSLQSKNITLIIRCVLFSMVLPSYTILSENAMKYPVPSEIVRFF